MPPEKIFKKKDKIDYTLKAEYDLSLISDEYRKILVRKNNGESFVEIARDFGCTSVNVREKARSAICKLSGKTDEKHLEKKRENSRKWYREHLEQERVRSREKNSRKKNRKNNRADYFKERRKEIGQFNN